MATANKVAAAAIAACALAAGMPALSAQQPSPAMIMARTVCFDEIRTLEASHAKEGKPASETARAVGDVLKSFVPAGEDRTHALTNTAKIRAGLATEAERDELELVLCAASVGVAADEGTRDLNVFKERWASEKERLSRPPVVQRPERPTQLTRITRSVCSQEIKALEADLDKDSIEDIILTFTQDPEPRGQVVNDFETMLRQPGADPAQLKRLAVSACAATMGTLWAVGMRTFAELNNHWTGRGRARFEVAGTAVQPNPFSCIWMDWDTDGRGVPGTLRNECSFTIDLKFCMAGSTPGSASEAVACEKGRSRFERIEPKSGVRTDLTDGTQIRWAACKAPLQPVETNAPGATFTATCK